MIQVSLIPTAEEFRDKAGSWLALKEVQNNVFLGVLANLLQKPAGQRFEHYFWLVEEEGSLKGAAFCTPPYKLTLSEMDKDSLIPLADFLRVSHPLIPGVGGPKETARHFSHLWNLKTQKPSFLEDSMRIYQLEQPAEIQFQTGRLQKAQPAETDLLTRWLGGFHREINLSEQVDERNMVVNYIREGRLFVWEDQGLRSMGAYTGETGHGIRITMVYTPSESRGKGYATSLVAALSRQLLDSGKKFCCLYADLLNPTTNSIYQKIGYKPVCDWNVYKFK